MSTYFCFTYKFSKSIQRNRKKKKPPAISTVRGDIGLSESFGFERRKKYLFQALLNTLYAFPLCTTIG